MEEKKMKDFKFSVVDIERKYTTEYNDTENYAGSGPIQWGKDNQLPNLLLNCYKQSATLKSSIDGMVAYILGNKIDINPGAAKFKDTVNRRGETMDDLVGAIALDYCIFGGFAIQVIYNKLGEVSELYALDFAKCRRNGDLDKILYSKKGWGKYTGKYEAYDVFNRADLDLEKGSQIFYYKGNSRKIYPSPMWEGALRDVLTEIECSKYALNAVSNGFQAKYLIDFKDAGNLTDEQKELIEKAIKDKFCNPDNEVNFMLHYGDGTNGVEVKKIETDDAPEKYIAIKDNARANIFTALRTSPLLAGLSVANTGFSTQEFSDSFKLYSTTVIAPIQKIIVRSLDKILGADTCITFEQFTIDIEQK